jgi:hypothetical protein
VDEVIRQEASAQKRQIRTNEDHEEEPQNPRRNGG